MDLEARIKKLEEKVEMLQLLLVEKKMNIDISKFPTKCKSFK